MIVSYASMTKGEMKKERKGIRRKTINTFSTTHVDVTKVKLTLHPSLEI
uniref:Uncharacterized protein n=1 Tax=Tetranychus urticae TaxID=32264 RepID=T1KVG5_TETUR